LKLEWMMLANHAEVAPNNLLYVSGGGWDTITVGGPIPGAPEGVAAVMVGSLAIRVLFHMTETDRSHDFQVSVMSEDGDIVAEVAGEFHVPRNRDVPPGWLQNWNLVLPITGVGLPGAGLYTINLSVNGQWMGDRPFRVRTAAE
jgi:hypothetical protein